MHVYGPYTNKVLRINVTDKTAAVEELPEEWKLKFMGARGFNMIRLLLEVPPDVDAMGPKNKLIFGVGPTNGTNIPGQRFNVSAKSPLTGILGDSNAGGHWGTELKYAGYDQLIIEGSADLPVYIYIEDDKVEIKDAGHLWGKTPKTVHGMIRDELDDLDIQVVCTGIGADKGVKFAGLFSNIVRANGRTGMGTVMSSKNVKAIAVKGNNAIKPYDFDDFNRKVEDLNNIIKSHLEFEKRLMVGTTHLTNSLNATGQLNTKNNQTGYFPFAEEVSGESLALQYNIKNKGCFGCIIPCSRYYRVPDGRFKGISGEGPEFETLAGFTSRVYNKDLALALKCHELCTDYGLDSITASGLISFSMECYEKGIIDQEFTGGLDLYWGNGDAILELLEQIGNREGFGDLLADGILTAVENFGEASRPYAMHGKGLDVFLGEPRGIKAYGLGNSVASRGADHVRSDPFFETLGDPQKGIEKFGVAETADRLAWKGKGMVVKYFEEWCAISDSFNMCKNTMVSMETLDFKGIADIYNALTGENCTPEDIQKIGERICNVERIYNVLAGTRKEDDTLPKRFTEEPLPEECGPSAGSVLELEPMLNEYYHERGWDVETGMPTTEKLNELNLDMFIDQLADKGVTLKEKN